MADVEVRRDSFTSETTTTTKKTKKVKKTKRRESADQGSEITITEVEQTTTDNNEPDQEEGYVNMSSISNNSKYVSFSLYFLIFVFVNKIVFSQNTFKNTQFPIVFKQSMQQFQLHSIYTFPQNMCLANYLIILCSFVANPTKTRTK